MENETKNPEPPDWREPPEPPPGPRQPSQAPDAGLYREFRMQVASRQFLDRYFQMLAKALRFSGEVRVELHDGQVMWTELRETWVDWPAVQKMVSDE